MCSVCILHYWNKTKNTTVFLLLPSLGAQREGCFHLHYYYPISLQAKFSPLFSAHSKLKIVVTVLHFPISSTKNIFHLILLPDTQKTRKTWQQDLETDTFRSWRTKIRKATPNSQWFQIRDSFQGLPCFNPLFWYGFVTCRDLCFGQGHPLVGWSWVGGELGGGDGAAHQDKGGGGMWPVHLYTQARIHRQKPFVDVQ